MYTAYQILFMIKSSSMRWARRTAFTEINQFLHNFSWNIQKERVHLWDKDIDGDIILKLIIKYNII